MDGVDGVDGLDSTNGRFSKKRFEIAIVSDSLKSGSPFDEIEELFLHRVLPSKTPVRKYRSVFSNSFIRTVRLFETEARLILGGFRTWLKEAPISTSFRSRAVMSGSQYLQAEPF